jgi:hypothetical protein
MINTHRIAVLRLSVAIVGSMSIVLALPVGITGEPFGNSKIEQKAFAQLQPDHIYTPQNGVLNVGPPESEILSMPHSR